jgi:gas vesicle protein
MTTKGSATAAFVIGALAGGVAALLLAPQTGAQLRRRLKNGAGELQHKGEKLKQSARDRADSVAGAVKSAVTEAKSSYRDELERRRQNEAVDTLARKTGA